jgi:hypothetical protein
MILMENALQAKYFTIQLTIGHIDITSNATDILKN